MSSQTLYFLPATSQRLERISGHLNGTSLSRSLAIALAVAEAELRTRPNALAESQPASRLPATRHTVYLHEFTQRRIERLQHRYLGLHGGEKVITSSALVARALAISEEPILQMKSDLEAELFTISEDAGAIEAEAEHVKEECSERSIRRLLDLMQMTAGLFTQVGELRARIEADGSGWRRPIWVRTFELVTEKLNPLMGRLGKDVTKLRHRLESGQHVTACLVTPLES